MYQNLGFNTIAYSNTSKQSNLDQSLAKKDILNSYKGSNGGFTLKRDCAQLTILEITTIAEEKIPSVFECTSQNEVCSGGYSVFPLLNNLQTKINDFLH
ncbi:MAG: Rrf2 family transcriptional regulator [Campylobacterota bacterium]|nr:Rrf2 family transcriptional regulator [Campylobacterota bacterium]